MVSVPYISLSLIIYYARWDIPVTALHLVQAGLPAQSLKEVWQWLRVQRAQRAPRRSHHLLLVSKHEIPPQLINNLAPGG